MLKILPGTSKFGNNFKYLIKSSYTVLQCMYGDCNIPKRTGPTTLPPKDTKTDYSPGKVKHDALTVPEFIDSRCFREFKSPCEQLGPNADKCGEYKNPEYYSYHRFSFYDLEVQAFRLWCTNDVTEVKAYEDDC